MMEKKRRYLGINHAENSLKFRLVKIVDHIDDVRRAESACNV